MMNRKRVRFFRKLIYAFIIIVLFLPLILMSFLTLRMISVSQAMQEQLQALTSAFSQSAPQPSSSQDGYVIEPEGQSTSGESPELQTTDGKNNGTNADGQSPNASGTQPEAGEAPSAQPTSSDTGGAEINDIGNNALNKLNGEDTAGNGVLDAGGNPGTGIPSSEDLSPPNYNGNPGMGC